MDFFGFALINTLLSLASLLGLVSTTEEVRISDSAPVEEAVTQEFAETGQGIVVTEKTSNEFYPVLSIVDGDTIKVSVDGKSEVVRLIGIDTPETVHPTQPVECFGIEARNKIVEMLGGQSVRLESDLSQDVRDKYERLLAYAFLADGTNINKTLIREGFAYEYTYNVPYKFQEDFKAAEEFAQRNEKGLWAPGACSEPVEVPKTIAPSAPKPISPSSIYTCYYNAYNCGDFSTHAEAQDVYESCGGISNDVHRLDGDKDGLACEK
ncbi:MAG: thermonuclease family protein [Patescibacteria group bacterium]